MCCLFMHCFKRGKVLQINRFRCRLQMRLQESHIVHLPTGQDQSIYSAGCKKGETDFLVNNL